METHVKVLAGLHIVLGALGLMCALLLTVVFGGAATLVGASGEPDAAIAVPIIGLAGMALVVFLLLSSLPGIVVGVGLWQRRSWARIAGIVLAVLNLGGVPILTLLGIYGLWVLFQGETAQMFSPEPQRATS